MSWMSPEEILWAGGTGRRGEYIAPADVIIGTMRSGLAPAAWTSAWASCDVHSAGSVYFLTSFSAHADGDRRGARSASEGGVGKASVRRVSRCLQIDTGPRPSPSACSRGIEKKMLDRRGLRVLLHPQRRRALLRRRRAHPTGPARRHVRACRRACRHAHGRAGTWRFFAAGPLRSRSFPGGGTSECPTWLYRADMEPI